MKINPHTALLACALLACKDDAQCIFYPCPLPLAATISVSALNVPAGIPGLTMTVSGAVTGGGPCNQGPVSTCVLMGGPGTYRVELRAPNYAPAELNLTITGTDAGCNTCGHVDSQQVSVTMQPAAG
jgi:hypothetical protein